MKYNNSTYIRTYQRQRERERLGGEGAWCLQLQPAVRSSHLTKPRSLASHQIAEIPPLEQLQAHVVRLVHRLDELARDQVRMLEMLQHHALRAHCARTDNHDRRTSAQSGPITRGEATDIQRANSAARERRNTQGYCYCSTALYLQRLELVDH